MAYDTAQVTIDSLEFGLIGTTSVTSETGVDLPGGGFDVDIIFNATIAMNAKVSFDVDGDGYYFVIDYQEEINGFEDILDEDFMDEEEYEEYELFNELDEKIGLIRFTEDRTEIYDNAGNLVS